MISKLLRLYRRSHGLRQICNIAVYIAHSACTIHLLNLPDKNAKRDITHGVKHLEEIAESWLCARRTLSILSTLAKKWKVEMPEEAVAVLTRTDTKFGTISAPSTPKSITAQPGATRSPTLSAQAQPVQNPTTFFNPNPATTSTLSYSIPTGSRTHRRPSTGEKGSLPPNSALEFQHRLHRHAPPVSNTATPGSTRPSMDSNSSTAGTSPSALFGGVDQLLRDSQDWWLQDQNQLALGFDNWNVVETTEETNWFPATTNGGAVNGRVGAGTNGFVTGAVQGLIMNGNVSGNGNANRSLDNGFNGYGNVNTYNEDEWYQ